MTRPTRPISWLRAVRKEFKAFPAPPEEINTGERDAETRDGDCAEALATFEGAVAMKRESRELVRGSGNVFADFGMPNAAVEQLKALLAAKIIKVLDAKKLSVRMAEEQSCIAAADFSRIRRVKLDRFTIDRLMKILERLDQRVEVRVKVTSATHSELAVA